MLLFHRKKKNQKNPGPLPLPRSRLSVFPTHLKLDTSYYMFVSG